MLEELTGQGLLIHHWDTDGISSAKLLLEKLKEKKITNKTPGLGNYFLTQEELEEYSNYDFVIVADMNLPRENILKLNEKAEIMIFDHHLGPEIEEVYHHNPIIKGQNPDEYPSASWIVNKYLKNKINLFALLGIVGDHEQKIKKNIEFNEKIERYCKENDLTFEDLHKMVYLIDSNYKIGDKKAVENAPVYLLDHDKAEDTLDNKTWNKNYEDLEKEMEKLLNQSAEEKNNIIIKNINTKFNIISTLTRKVAWKNGKNTIVINTGFFKDKDQVYVRCKKTAEPMIQRGKECGFKCGGKKEVLGAIVPKENTNSFIEEIIEYLK